MKRIIAAACATILLASGILSASEYYVDNARGDDQNPGGKETPFLTIGKAFKVMKGGDTLHLVPNNVPYGQLRIKGNEMLYLQGSPEKRTIVDGHGAVISGLTHYTADQWKDEGAGVFSMRLGNNAWVMDQQGYWSGFPIVFLDGKPADFVKSREELAEGTYFLFKKGKDPLHNMLYVKLPSGKTPGLVKIEAPGNGGVSVDGVSYVEIRNMSSMYCVGDGFATCWGKGIVFENIRGCFNMDQGISNHSADAIVMNSRFDSNAGCGIADVNMNEKSPCRVKYLNCIVENDTFRGGVEFYEGEFEMKNCIIRNNQGKALELGRGAKATFENCIFIEGKDRKLNGVGTGGKCVMSFSNCTFYGFGTAINLSAIEDTQVSIENSAFINCGTNYWIMRKYKENVFELGKILHADWNFFNMGGAFTRDYNETTRKAKDSSYGFDKLVSFAEKAGIDRNSIVKSTEFSNAPYSLPELKGKGGNGGNIGADLNPDMAVGPGVE